MRIRFNTSRRAYTVALLTGLLFVVGVAFAQWLATGTGEGYAKAGTALDLGTLDVSTLAVGDLYPGGSGTLVLAVSNPNPYPVTITAVTGDGTIAADLTACVGHGVTFTDQTGLNLVVGAGFAVRFELAGAVEMAATSPTECQGAVFTIPVLLNGGSGGSGGTPNYIGECSATVAPSPEILDNLDNDCDGQVDEGLDADSDGFAAEADGGFDCDDTNDAINPGAYDEPGDGIDQDCDGHDSEAMTCDPGWVNMDGVCFDGDLDDDGFTTMQYAGPDCDDTNDSINPDAMEIDDGVDNDCDGQVDEGY